MSQSLCLLVIRRRVLAHGSEHKYATKYAEMQAHDLTMEIATGRGISIALAIRSFDLSGQLIDIHSVDHSLFIRVIAPYR